MINDEIAIHEIEQLGCQFRLPENERALNEAIEAYRAACSSAQHAANVTKHLLQNNRYFPLPAEIRVAAAITNESPQAGYLSEWENNRAVCPECNGTRFVPSFVIKRKILRDERIGEDVVQVYDHTVLEAISVSEARAIQRGTNRNTPASWKRSLRAAAPIAAVATVCEEQSMRELSENEQLLEMASPCEKCSGQKAGAA